MAASISAIFGFKIPPRVIVPVFLEFTGSHSVNSISISGMLTPSHLLGQKVKPRWPPMEGNFRRQIQSSSLSCTSVPVLYATLIFSFCLVRLRKHSQSWKKCTDELLLDQFYIFECLKGFIITVSLKSCPKLSKDGKLTVTKRRALSTFLK